MRRSNKRKEAKSLTKNLQFLAGLDIGTVTKRRRAGKVRAYAEVSAATLKRLVNAAELLKEFRQKNRLLKDERRSYKRQLSILKSKHNVLSRNFEQLVKNLDEEPELKRRFLGQSPNIFERAETEIFNVQLQGGLPGLGKRS